MPEPDRPRSPSPPLDSKPAPPESAEGLYAQAEAAMQVGNVGAAAAALTRVVERFPDDPLHDTAEFELARLAFRRHEYRGARTKLQHLLARTSDPALLELARYLRCRVDLAEASAGARACLEAFRRDFVGSPHDAEVLANLASLAAADEGCRAAAPLYAAYLSAYPRGPFAPEAARRRAACDR